MTSSTHPNPQRRRFIRLAGGGTLAAALPLPGLLGGCQAFSGMPDSALHAWQGPASDDIDVRLWAMSWAILAPNPHNRQPWFLALQGDDSLTLSLDTTRLLPETDPFGRQIVIGTGALLGLLQIAAAERGYRLEQTYFPEGTFDEVLDSRPVATVRFIADDTMRTLANSALFRQIPLRHTRRDVYQPDLPPGNAFTAALGEENRVIATRGLTGGLVDRDAAPARFTRIDAIARRAWRLELGTPHTMLESMRLLRIGAREIDQHRDGISLTAPMLVLMNQLGLIDRNEAPSPESATVRRQISDFDSALDSTPAFYWLASRGNTRLDQLASGEAYVRAQLLATQHGLAMHPLSQALQEYSEMRDEYAAIHTELSALAPGGLGDAPTLQMLCRIGAPASGLTSATAAPRRGLDAHRQLG